MRTWLYFVPSAGRTFQDRGHFERQLVPHEAQELLVLLFELLEHEDEVVVDVALP